ncbi:SusC/RagA family TonB-linked outer membrane protein [Flavivirga sp. 57AJ16]|uniref:SusC/RagA family TonB-linked outer membrane protein n=1 Tax=Flavivirga sp. 57AJ16 TaxID=3025307 RepID=UPI0023652154|nr:SusC/RagA family TonB-linked outer membrane protein [Flavivirga sp. 57AJ16]MDD7888310.1 SusC/RagA family TonB-linked outer membrane protein [Flavivirga sp. 57AJ16]
MKNPIFLLCIALSGLLPNCSCAQGAKVSIDSTRTVPVGEMFDIINRQTGYSFIYNRELFAGRPGVVLEKGVFSIRELLALGLPAGELDIIVTENNTIVIKGKEGAVRGGGLRLSGTVRDGEGRPVPGAAVLVKGSGRGTATDLEGRFAITVARHGAVLELSSLGFRPREVAVGGRAHIDVSLEGTVEELGAVEIVGNYYKRSRQENPGNVYRLGAGAIAGQPVSNPLAAMNGRVPGVNIVQDTGLPGGGFRIEVRGKNFINAGEPLYVVDGVPYSAESLSFPLVNTVLPGESPLNLIAPSDIESIEVLKDADATAIYGSRGANGVVLIATRRGRPGKARLEVGASTGVAAVPRFVDLLGTGQYLEMRLEALANDGLTPGTVPPALRPAMPDLFEWAPDRYTDWQEVLIGGTAHRSTGRLSLSGGSERTRFLIGGSYHGETTVLPGDSRYGRASLQGSISHRSPDGRLRADLLANYAADDNRLPLGRLTQQAYGLPPNAPALRGADGGLNWDGWTVADNPLALLEGGYRARSRNLLLSTSVSYRPVPALELRAGLGLVDYRKREHRATPHTRFNPAYGLTSATGSSLLTGEAGRLSWNVEPQLEWRKGWGNVELGVLAGATFQRRLTHRASAHGEGFPDNGRILDMSAADRVTQVADQGSRYSYQAVFGRLNIKWAGRYIVNFTGRRDGSSRFGPGRQFGDFGAIGAAWIFSRAAFLGDRGPLSHGKLRASYGVTGSDNIGDHGFYRSYTAPGSADYGGPVLLPTSPFNPAFGWEETKKFEAALELGLFGDRVLLEVAWYRNRSSDQLLEVPLPGTTGFGSVTANFGATVENTGIEIDLRSVNVRGARFKWTTALNISAPRNRLARFDGLERSPLADRYEVGRSLDIRKLYHMTGVDPATGTYTFEDYSGDGGIGPEDRQWIEDTAPGLHGGLGNSLEYGPLSLEVFLQFKKQRGARVSHGPDYPGILSNQHVSVLGRWQRPGDGGPAQRYTMGLGPQGPGAVAAFRNYADSSARYTDTSFVRLRNLFLGYALPKGAVPGIEASIYLQGQNLLTLTRSRGADPEHFTASALPVLRSLALGVRLGL